MSGFLLFNIGNTHTQWIFADNAGALSGEVNTLDTAAWMKQTSLLPDAGTCEVWGASVVPQAKEIIASCGRYKEVKFVNPVTASNAGLDFSMVDSSTLGSDRIANAAGLLAYPLPAGCFDCGTAITLELVSSDRKFTGGAIMPGRKLMRQSLFKGTAALPELPLDNVLPDAPGRNTLAALALGIDRGAVGMVRELMTLAERENVHNILFTGGDADFFAGAFANACLVEKKLTLRGIAYIASHQGCFEQKNPA